MDSELHYITDMDDTYDSDGDGPRGRVAGAAIRKKNELTAKKVAHRNVWDEDSAADRINGILEVSDNVTTHDDDMDEMNVKILSGEAAKMKETSSFDIIKKTSSSAFDETELIKVLTFQEVRIR